VNRLVVLGAGGHGRVVADAAEMQAKWSSICFLDDSFPTHTMTGAWPIIGPTSEGGSLPASMLAKSRTDEFIVAIGNATTRLRLIDQLRQSGCKIATVVHPSAVVSSHVTLENGIAILAGACVNIGTRLGTGVILNTGSTVDHDCQLAEGVHVCPGAHLAGSVIVGRRTWIGVGACVRHGISLGDDVTIGAGAAVVSNIPDGALAVGVPARGKPKT
jgi:sugar O-acyltransferase (sialic acid O-acetyltransferase NeuD family)